MHSSSMKNERHHLKTNVTLVRLVLVVYEEVNGAMCQWHLILRFTFTRNAFSSKTLKT